MTEPRVLTLPECLQLAFTSSNEIKQAREQMVAVGGEKLSQQQLLVQRQEDLRRVIRYFQ